MKPRTAQSAMAAAVFLCVYGLVIAAFFTGSPVRTRLAAETALRPWEVGAFLVAAILLGALFIRRVNVRMVVELLVGFLLLLGVWFYVWRTIGDMGLIIAGALTVLQAWARTVWAHNLFIALGAAGAILYLAFLFPPLTWGILLVGLAMYDTVAGRAKRVVDRFAHAVVHRGILPLALVPPHIRDLKRPFVEGIRQEGSRAFGVMELVLPGTLVAHAAARGGVAPWMIAVVLVGAGAWSVHRSAPPLLTLAIAATISFFFLV